MPSRLWCGFIIVFWLASTAWLVQRDVLPSLGLGQLTYDRALSARAVEEPVEWHIYREDKEVGNLFFAVDPRPQGDFELRSRAKIEVEIPPLEATEFYIKSTIFVDPLKRLDRLEVSLSLPQSGTEVTIDGHTNDDELSVAIALMIAGKERFKRDLTFAVDRSVMMLDMLGQIDRLPDLYPGRTWRTRFINPVTALLTGTVAPSTSLDYIQHEVVETETIEWDEREWPCYKVEHRYQKAATHSWARVSDGKVLVQEVLFGGIPFRLVAEPNPGSQRILDQPTGGNDG